MDFLGIGLPEIILILIVALIVVGPKRLPEVAAQIARVIRQLRGYATDVTSQMRSELDELTREYEQVRKELEELRQVAAKDLDSVSREVERTVREAPAIIESSAEAEPEKRPSPPGEETTRDDDS
ncbi:MAG: twin-arginine translocase subunit TatB [Dehalococcoidia bacterium]|nr:MAG: twin-arginine translocase subunit TatB [Dehalococcoidia bacterium]